MYDAALALAAKNESKEKAEATKLDAVPEESNAEINKIAADEVLEIVQKYSGQDKGGDMSINEIKKLIKGTEIAPTKKTA